MKNIFKDNSLASCLLGIIIGAGGHAGYTAIVDAMAPQPQAQISGIASFPGSNGQRHHAEQTNFDIVPEDEDGDCVITPNGKKYHNPDGCTYLRKSKQVRLVSSDKAMEAGITPCSKCM